VFAVGNASGPEDLASFEAMLDFHDALTSIRVEKERPLRGRSKGIWKPRVTADEKRTTKYEKCQALKLVRHADLKKTTQVGVKRLVITGLVGLV
jgi:hypothetical protein